MNKEIILYGVSASCELILQAYYEWGLKERRSFFVDGHEELDGLTTYLFSMIVNKKLSGEFPLRSLD